MATAGAGAHDTNSSSSNSSDAVAASAAATSSADDAGSVADVACLPQWWRHPAGRAALLTAYKEAYLDVIRHRVTACTTQLTAIHQVYYAMKANWNEEVLKTVADCGVALECVSLAEVQHVRGLLGDAVPVMFTPNFCPVEEYTGAYDLGCDVTVDGHEVLALCPERFRGRRIAVRVDPGRGSGHHDKVITAGPSQKFGFPVADMLAVADAADALGASVVGLHAHVGSGITDVSNWAGVLRMLAPVVNLERPDGRKAFPALEWMDIGGGLGIVNSATESRVDLVAVNAHIADARVLIPDHIKLRMEPGRFLVGEAGVLAAPVTQVRHKGDVCFVGLATGMNSLIRPALYNAVHPVWNATNSSDDASVLCHVVGPICESGDIIRTGVMLPPTRPGDVMLVGNAGAYGRVMSSSYNMREPAKEVPFTMASPV